MKRLIALLIIPTMLASCQRQPRTASQTLVAYFDAIAKQDTVATYALSAKQRLVYLRPQAKDYFQMCYLYPASVSVVRETPVIKGTDTMQVVRFIEAVHQRSGGGLVDSCMIDCQMVRENGEWKVLECLSPPVERYNPKGGNPT